MTHAEFIKTLSTKRGARSEYAQKLGLSLSFLWQIENRRAVTPKRCYENVILLTNGRVFYFCNQVNERGTAVVWQGQAYEPYPIKADGFESTSQGAGNRPTLTVSNLLGLITGAADQFGQLVGVQVVRRQTYAKFLDAVNFQSGRNPTADPMQEVVGKYLVERMTALNAETATFELAAPSESDGSVIPARIMLANTCCWQYRGEGCGYPHTASAKIDRLAETVSRNDAARSSEINTLTAKLENVEVGGRNYALSTAAADKILTVSGNNQTKSVTLDVSSSLDLKQGDALIIACDLDIVNATSMFGKPYPRIGVELSVTYSDNTIGYFSAWYDEAVKDAPKTLKRRLIAKHTVAKDVKAVRGLIVQARYQTSDSIKVSGVKLERGTVATDWSPAPEDSNADTSALTALSAKVQQASSAVAEIGGKIQSLYTLKTEAIAGGRRAVAGVAVGADGKTGSGEILLMADKVAYVDPKDKTVTPAFVTVIENGRAKQALNGDLFASGSVLAKHLAANLTVEAPTLNGATVNAGLINGGTIRGARIEAVDLEAANIIGDVVAVRTFELKQSPLGYQELICQIPDSRKARRTVIVPPVFAVAENGAVVSLQLYMDGVIQREVTIQSPEKRIERNEKFSVWVPGGPPLYMRTPQDVPLSFSVPFHLPKIGSISFQKGIDGAAHSLHILCRISGNFDYSPLGDLSGIVCLIV